jgi:UDP-N-acetyl-2-amino-2-deoxyglucuronate dehydrogenase
MNSFALIGAAGFIAPRHLKAIKQTGNDLVAALDKHDNVGILDSYFPDADFFTEFERFDRHLDKLKRKGTPVQYVSICSPNYLHDSHIRYALRYGAHAICEKPIVLNPWNLEALATLEEETGKRVYTILQLRHHASILALRDKIRSGPKDKVYDIDLSYITSRGHWYHSSWKGDHAKSGGIATNIGIHFFDMLIWIFGAVKESLVTELNDKTASGKLLLNQARVNWSLSIDYNTLPESVKAAGKRTYRSLTMGGEEIEFSDGFTDLHTTSYDAILKGEGFGLTDAVPSVELAYSIRNAVV